MGGVTGGCSLRSQNVSGIILKRKLMPLITELVFNFKPFRGHIL